MSMRAPPSANYENAPKPQTAVVAPPVPTSVEAAAATLSFDDLTPDEQRAASLGIEPGQLRCIGWLNKAHKETLVSKGLLSPSLQADIEAHEKVAMASGA